MHVLTPWHVSGETSQLAFTQQFVMSGGHMALVKDGRMDEQC